MRTIPDHLCLKRQGSYVCAKKEGHRGVCKFSEYAPKIRKRKRAKVARKGSEKRRVQTHMQWVSAGRIRKKFRENPRQAAIQVTAMLKDAARKKHR